jgi:hypothetical protein
MKKLIALSAVAAMAATGVMADQAADIEKLQKDIKRLKASLSEVKAQAGGDNIKWDVDFRTAVDMLEYETASGAELKNDSLLSNRLWLGMGYAPSANLVFKGQLAMQKAYGAAPTNLATGYPQRGYGYDAFDWVINDNMTDGTVRVREAYWLYKSDSLFNSDVSWTASFGRRPSTNGFLASLRDDDKPKSPLGHVINLEFDGASFKFGLDKVTGVDGMYWKLCLGRGLSNARARFNMDGGLNAAGDYTTDNTTLENVDMAGFIFVPYDDGQYSVQTTFYRGFNVPGFDMANGTMVNNDDGTFSFTGNTGMVGTVAPAWDGSGNFAGVQAGTINSSMQMVNMGDQDGAAISFMANGIGDGISDFLDDTILFGSFAWSKSRPSNERQGFNLNAFDGFVGADQATIAAALAGYGIDVTADLDGDGTAGTANDFAEGMVIAGNAQPTVATGQMGSTEDETGTSYWIGAQFPAMFTEDGRIGIEFNHGSEYWRPFTYAEDTMAGSKLATRGDAYEIYYTQPLMTGLSMQLRATHMEYDYTGSQGFFGGSGMPLTMEEAQAFGMDPIAKATDIRFYIRYRY